MKLYVIAKTGLVPCVLLKTTGPYTEGATHGFTPTKAEQLIKAKVAELAAKLPKEKADKLGIQYEEVVVKVESNKSDNAGLVEAQQAAEKAAEEAKAAKAETKAKNSEIEALKAQLAAKGNPQK